MHELVRALETSNEPSVSNQHVVSQVILREFAGRDRNGGTSLVILNLEFNSQKLRGTQGCGKIPNWMPLASHSIEQVWQGTENLLGEALDSLKNGSIFEEAVSSRILRETVALHYVRSIHMRFVAQRAALEAGDLHIRGLVRQNPGRFASEFLRRIGHRPRSIDELIDFVDEIVRDKQQKFVEAIFRVKSEEAFYRIREIFSVIDFQIIVAPQGQEFLIGDAPVCGASPYSRRETNPYNGLGIYSAKHWTMPLTPSHAIRLPAQTPAYLKASRKDVDTINVGQIRNAYRHVYCRPPGAALTDFVRANGRVWKKLPEIGPLRLIG